MDMDGVFVASALVIFYIYLGYPLLLAAWARVRPHPPRKARIDTIRSWPAISIVVAARNEAACLPDRLANLLEIDYPGERQVIVVSDGSIDGSLHVVQESLRALRLDRAQVEVIEIPRAGKPSALNAGVAEATGEILIFADARQRFSSDALVELVANFADERVGGVTGQLVLDCETPSASDSSVADGVGLYWKYEKWLRRNESAVWSTLGATGAIYALRRTLWSPLPADTLLDDVLAPMRAVLAGKRIVFEERAIAYDQASQDAQCESRRKTRTLAGNYQILGHEPRLLLPVLNPVWLQYVSHKIGRLLVPWALVFLFVSSVFLAPVQWYYAAALTVQVGFYGLAGLGAWFEFRGRPAPREFKGLPVSIGKGAR